MTGQGFTNPVVGGQGILKRTAIRSLNYVIGLTGWSINADGSAEFSNGTFRGTLVLSSTGQAVFLYNGTPALGTLFASIATSSGLDPYGNSYFQGFTAYPGGIGGPIGYLFRDSNLNNFGGLSMFPGGDIRLENDSPTAKITITGNGNLEINHPLVRYLLGTAFQLGNGPSGKYYFEQFAIGAVSVPTGAGSLTSLATAGQPLTVSKSRKDYSGTQMTLTTAIWTCPESGPYSLAVQFQYVGGVAGTRVALYALRNANGAGDPDLVMDVMDGSGRGRISASTIMEYTAGDTLTFTALQVTGAAQTIHPGPGSYIAIRRCL